MNAISLPHNKFTLTFDPNPEPPLIPEGVLWTLIGLAMGALAALLYYRFPFH